MKRLPVRYYLATIALLTIHWSIQAARPVTEALSNQAVARLPSEGELRAFTQDGTPAHFPLEHTAVDVEITGNLARVLVTQTFGNPFAEKIEAIYVFPLSGRAAVSDMQIQVGERTIKGEIKTREEAQRIFEKARRAGHIAALLDQERPNIFTQTVTNILPGDTIKVQIRYFETVRYESGSFEFSFPMVVGPRFIPGNPLRHAERGWAPDTTNVPDASRITPPVFRAKERAAHRISLGVSLVAGARIEELTSPSHRILTEKQGADNAIIHLAQEDSIPNRDFILRYRTSSSEPQLVLLPHRTDEDGYFLLLIQPEFEPAPTDVIPKEMIFVVDCSGSMIGSPIEKVKEAMRYALKNLNPLDNFQIISFANGVRTFRSDIVPATPLYVEKGLRFIDSLSGTGGTIMLEGVRMALDYPVDPQRFRIISFMTDGLIGNESQILAHLKENLGQARLFPFGIGSSPNRHLLDSMAEIGRGAVEYLFLGAETDKRVKRFYERIRNPYLTDVQLDWGELEIEEIYPKLIPDLFLGQPLVLTGRYRASGNGRVTLTARLGEKPFEKRYAVVLPDRQEQGEAIPRLWARARIKELSHQLISSPMGVERSGIVEEITETALVHHLVSAYTSFVAVEYQTLTGDGEPRMVEVPVSLPEGVSYKGVFGNQGHGRIHGARDVDVYRTSGEVIGGVVGGVVGGTLGGVPGGMTEQPLYAGFGGVTNPELIPDSRVEPKYPHEARRAGVQGQVILQAVVRKDGTVDKIKVLKSPGAKLGFDKAAIEAVKQWRYRPGLQSGKPVDVYFTIVVEFCLNRPKRACDPGCASE